MSALHPYVPITTRTFALRPIPAGFRARNPVSLRMRGARTFPSRSEQLRAICAPTADTRPLLYDLFCKAGGCTKGYQMAGFRVVGVDIESQKNYIGDGFIQMDALEFMARYLRGAFPVAAAFHASPPCQFGSQMFCPTKPEARENHLNLIEPIRKLLIATGKPFVIENVKGMKKYLINPLLLHGSQFDLPIFRDRYFEIEPPIYFLPNSPRRDYTPVPINSSSKKGNTYAPAETMRQALGIDWYITKSEAREAIPPAYTHFIGRHLMSAIRPPRPTPAQPSGGEGANERERAEEYRSAVDDMQTQWDDVTRKG
jgi:DNA (cytosine-5)-methyltransferase 1